MQIVLRMTTNEFHIFREYNVTFNNSGALADSGFVRLFGMLWKLHRCAAMTN